MKKNSALFTGYYGYKNTGDDLFVLISTYAAKKYWPNLDYSILSTEGPTSISIKPKYSLKKIFNKKIFNILYSYYVILKSKTITLSGGSILNAKPKILSIRWFIYFLMRIKYLKVNAIGVSLGPFNSKSDFEFIKDNLKFFEFLALRDQNSYQIAKDLELAYSPILADDLAFMLPYMIKSKKSVVSPKSKKIIGISLCHYERYYSLDINNEERRENEILNLLNLLKNEEIEFHFFIINGNVKTGDKDYTIKIINKLNLNNNKYKLFDYDIDTLKTVERINNCDFIFSTRLHGAIIAAAMNIPSILVEYHRKCTDYLDDMNINNQWRVGDMTIDNNLIFNKIKFLLSNSIEDYYPNRDKKITNVLENFTDNRIIKIQNKENNER
jgi:polysaccharide pyruvyl transferase WcaK-like protein